jgi:DnaK suppressor protein
MPMTLLTAEQLRMLAARLDVLKARSTSDLRAAHAAALADADARRGELQDRADQAEAGRAEDVRRAEARIDAAALADEAAARRRLRDGTYGWCRDCGQSIAFERLLAQPTALCCAACEGQRERAIRPA